MSKKVSFVPSCLFNVDDLGYGYDNRIDITENNKEYVLSQMIITDQLAKIKHGWRVWKIVNKYRFKKDGKITTEILEGQMTLCEDGKRGSIYLPPFTRNGISFWGHWINTSKILEVITHKKTVYVDRNGSFVSEKFVVKDV